MAIPLSLFHLGVKNIHLGPTLPVFVTPNALSILQNSFNIKPIGMVDEDLIAILDKQPVAA